MLYTLIVFLLLGMMAEGARLQPTRKAAAAPTTTKVPDWQVRQRIIESRLEETGSTHGR